MNSIGIKNLINDEIRSLDIYLLIQEMIKEDSRWGLGIVLLWFVQKALPYNVITIYEAFQLMEISDKLQHDVRELKFFSDDIVQSMNLALIAKLFDENELYKCFCKETLNRRDSWYKILKENNGGKLPKDKYYILDNLEGFLSAELNYMEMLSEKRAHTRRNSRKEFPYHWSYFPYDDFKYEDELIKVLKGEIDHYEVDKTISPEICDMMAAIELRAIELE